MPRIVIATKDPLVSREEALARVPKGVPSHTYFGWELSAEVVFEHLAGGSLFEPSSAHIYVDFLDFKVLKAQTAQVEQALAACDSSGATLICTQVIEAEWKSQEQRVLNSEAFQRFAKGAQLLDLRSASEGDNAARWLMQWGKRSFGVDVAADAARQLLGLCAGSIATAGAELYKLVELLPEGQTRIGQRELGDAVSALPAAQRDAAAEAILACAPHAQRLLEDLRLLGEEVIPVVNDLGRKFLNLRSLERGEQIYPAFLAGKLRPFAARWSGLRLAKALSLTSDLEYGLKSGRYHGESSQEAAHRALQVYARDLAAIR